MAKCWLAPARRRVRARDGGANSRAEPRPAGRDNRREKGAVTTLHRSASRVRRRRTYTEVADLFF